ncbi:MAG: restriction endonuclease subunit S, partial [Hymenobacter sp.]
QFLAYLSTTSSFVDECIKSSVGSTNRVRLNPNKFLKIQIPLPHPDEQRRLVARLEQVQTNVAEIKRLRAEQQHELRLLLRQQFRQVIADAFREPMSQVAPIVRRPIELDEDATYHELGIRSFGKGTFHKPGVPGMEVGTKKLYYIQPDDLLFSNVFAWEGAIAVAKPEDAGRVGSHRFISCLCNEEKVLPEFLRYYFLTPEGMTQIIAASPGGAGRNKTLGLEKLERIQVPVPHPDIQRTFLALHSRIHQLIDTQHAAQADLDLLLPSALDKAFRGELQ